MSNYWRKREAADAQVRRNGIRAWLQRRRNLRAAQEALRDAYARNDDSAADRLFQQVLDLQAGR